MRALVLDFDGVVSDSAREAFEVARRTWLDLRPDSGVARVPEAELYARFLELMPLGNRAEDYATALAAVEVGAQIPDQPAYDAFRARQDAGFLRDFHRRFYRVRADLAASDPETWHAMLRPYPEMVALLRRRAGEVPYAIATAKDHRSVVALLERYGIADLFPERLVLDKETGVTKRAHLEHLHRELGVDFPEMTFVDDKVNHLDSVASLGVRGVLAAWGYNGPREEQLARAHGHRVAALDEAEEALFGSGPPSDAPVP